MYLFCIPKRNKSKISFQCSHLTLVENSAHLWHTGKETQPRNVQAWGTDDTWISLLDRLCYYLSVCQFDGINDNMYVLFSLIKLALPYQRGSQWCCPWNMSAWCPTNDWFTCD